MKTVCALVAVGCLMAASCKKENVATDWSNIWENCPQKHDQTSTFRKLNGEWQLVAQSCGRCLQPGIRNAETNVRLVFTLADTTLQTFVGGKLEGKTKFFLEKSYNEGFFSLKTTSSSASTYTFGVLEFCNDKVAFRNGYVDGMDYYFQRK